MLYKYVAYNSSGKSVEGEMEGNNVAEILVNLQKEGLKPVVVKPKYNWFGLLRTRLGSGKVITIKDQAFLSRYLYLMLKVGTNLIEAIGILKGDFPKQAVRNFLSEAEISLKKGQPFWKTFAKYPSSFSPTLIAMIRAGEESGKLEETFHKLSISLEKDDNLRRSVRSALIYPALLVFTSLVVIGVIVFFAMPRISRVFLSTGVEPPTFTKAVIATSGFLSAFGIYIGIFLVVFAIGYWFFYSKTEVGKQFTFGLAYRTPVLGSVLEKIDLQALCSTLSSLLSSGLPIIETINIAADVVRKPKLKEALHRITKSRLARGQTLDEAFRSEKENFPQALVSLIGMSEKAGHLGSTFQTLADFYTSEVDATVKGLMSVLEPVLLVFIGVIVAIVALSTIVPIYQMVTKVTS